MHRTATRSICCSSWRVASRPFVCCDAVLSQAEYQCQRRTHCAVNATFGDALLHWTPAHAQSTCAFRLHQSDSKHAVFRVVGSAVFHEPAVTQAGGGIVLVKDISFASTCKDTLLPFRGGCHVAYVPSQPEVLGLSKLARLVCLYAKRICSQQDMTHAIRSAVEQHMPCAGVLVVSQARHLAHGPCSAAQTCWSFSGCFASPDSVHRQVRRTRSV